MQNRLRISLVIPVYNEESYLADCLRTALAQRLPFDEIIVVDNNSDDATVRILQRFPEVTLLKEPRQGVVHARNRGFDATTGDIIARVDADTRLPADWTLELTRIFTNPAVVAVTGDVSYYETAFAQSLSAADNLLRRGLSRLLGPNMALQGANMALRRSAWHLVRTDVCARGGVHEDFDLAIHISQHGGQVRYDSNLRARVAFRQAASGWRAFMSYYLHCPKTYLSHGIRHGYWLVPVTLGMIVAYPVLHLCSRLATVRSKQPFATRLRVNPATFVD